MISSLAHLAYHSLERRFEQPPSILASEAKARLLSYYLSANDSVNDVSSGANQAVACARLAPPDVKVRMVGNVGDDTFGRDYFEGLKKEGIDARGVRMLKEKKTGVSNIIVDEATGENRILFTANANFDFEGEGGGDLIPKESDVVVFQLEIPVGVVSLPTKWWRKTFTDASG